MSTVPDKSSAANKTAEKLNEALPVQLTARDVHQNPEFVKLLSSLTQHLNNEGITVQVQKDYQQAQEEIRHAKHTWLLQNVLYQELKELLLDYELKGQEVAMSSDDKQFHSILQECLTLAEVEDYLDCNPDPGSEVTLLGLSKDYLYHQNPYKKNLPYLQQKLIPEIEDRLRKNCENLVDFYEPQNEAGNSQLTFAKSSQLPAMVETDRHKLEEEKKLLKKERQNKDRQFSLYYQTLLDSLELIEQLISRHKLQNQAEHDTVTTEWLVARCDGLCLKIRLMELQILCDTYTKETVKALSKVREHLDVAMKEKRKEYTHATEALKSYESVGMGFDDLVEQYKILKEEIENKQWALNELQNC